MPAPPDPADPTPDPDGKSQGEPELNPEDDAISDARAASERRDPGSIEALRARTSVGQVTDEHWSRARAELNKDALDYLRERNSAPGVADADKNPRNSYCMECDGVLPLSYDSRSPASKKTERCPHCGAKIERNIRRMFNWVEMDQVPDSDLKALLPLFAGVGLVLALLVWWIL